MDHFRNFPIGTEAMGHFKHSYQNCRIVRFAAIAAALLATIAFAETAPRVERDKNLESARPYLPSGSDATGGFTTGAFTLPPA